MDPMPHAVCLPFPALGHINPMLQVAKLLHSQGFHVTFVNTEHYHNRFLKVLGPEGLVGLPSFRFEAIPEGLARPDPEAKPDEAASFFSIVKGEYVAPLRALIERLNGSGVPPVTCIVSDYIMCYALDVAEELGLQKMVYSVLSVCTLLCISHYQKLIDMGIVPFKDDNYMSNGELDTVLDSIPGAEGIRLRDIPTHIRTTDRHFVTLHFFIRMARHIKKASAILFNSFDELERDALHSLSSEYPPLYAIGPLQLMLDSAGDERTRSIRLNVWKEDPSCIAWLDSHGPRTVVYVNFGSMVAVTKDQFLEFAWGLADSNHPFLWVARPDLVLGEDNALPPEFLEETRDRGMILSWCNQEQVLAHPAVGLFLTHSGWNSTIESIFNGVPMICWPFMGDQQTNCWYCCSKLGIARELDSSVKRSDVEARVRELMEGGEAGKGIKEKANEWKGLAREAATATSGSSYMNLKKATKLLLSRS